MSIKGVVLGGGTASRLLPLTKSLTKHCLPVYDRPMIYYPIQSLVKAGITDIMLVTNPEFMQQYIDLLGSGEDLGCNIVYGCQMKAGGISQALLVAESFVGCDDCCVILGDNIFEDDIKPWVDKFNKTAYFAVPDDYLFDAPRQEHCHVVCKPVPVSEASNYGVLSDDGSGYGQIHIVEKPNYLTNGNYDKDTALAVTGLYLFTKDVFDRIRELKPSARGELEVSDLTDRYAGAGELSYSITDGKWFDCGINVDELLNVANEIREINQGE